jgi:hypothetical protein
MKTCVKLSIAALLVSSASGAYAGWSFSSYGDPYDITAGKTATFPVLLTGFSYVGTPFQYPINGDTYTLGSAVTYGASIDSTPLAPQVPGSLTPTPFPGTTTTGSSDSLVINSAYGTFSPITDDISFTAAANATAGAYYVTFYQTVTGPDDFSQSVKVGSFEVDVSTAPEPAQTLAGAMLLGCGGLIFAGRRLFSKKSA